ncbi:MAG TPA: carbon-nitrogen family hydrolase [Chroococcales cyanobacterium]|jgi:predicted amidohydrolase
MKVAAIQLDVRIGQGEHNLERAEEMICRAAKGGAEIIALPELWHSGYDLERAGIHAAQEKAILDRLSLLAKKHHLFLFAGSLLRQEKGGIGNSSSLIGPDGGIIAHYEKLHLFRLMDEDKYLSEGRSPILADTPWGKIGMAICYDLRFPELFRFYAQSSAKIVVIPAEWPAARIEHWKILIRARAIENQLFILAVNRCGKSGETLFGGFSALIDPWGEVVAELKDEEGLYIAELEMSRIEEARSKIPILSDRRRDLRLFDSFS